MNESQIASAADKTSPLKAKKPFWKRWWFWLIVVIAVLAVAGIGTNTAKGPAAQTQSSQTSAPAESDDKAESAPSKPEADVPAEYANALKSAENYSDMMHMSRQAIYDQLTSEFDLFTAEEAQYAVDNLQADYNANALASAKNYQETMAMSPEAIRDQLTSEYGGKFTQEEADYAIAHLND
ncbi:Ltp family lipoprotein [Bifidobacterium pullorum subsp. saeculare]|uniref:Ltp family lipoprotein n=1 Tax=Bifidobacterium pullorum TaxID=78448 RepID=UPI0019587E12|nr:Ltp family lipoprotein [Bifidobacterium pullorum]MBM6706405.1 Ltp family lipoprotein [Bifidobacterium pullorum subsp. saeculare]